LQLGKSMFVSSHLISVIEEAKAGNRIVQSDIFDGSGQADEVVASTSIIGNKKTISKALDGESDETLKQFAGQEAWPVTTSYFKLAMDNTSESLPIYEASFLLYENGVSRNLLMRYPDYSLKATLQKLEYLEKSTCNN